MLPLFALVIGALGWPLESTWIASLWVLAAVFYSSFDPLIVYKRTSWVSILVELLGNAAILGTIVILRGRLSLDAIVLLFIWITFAKAAALAVYFRGIAFRARSRLKPLGRFDFRYFVSAGPFFLLTFSGMLLSRVDLYTVRFLLGAQDMGRYQVFTSVLILLQTPAALLLMPLVKRIYRLEYGAIFRLANRTFVLGLLLASLGLPVIYFLLNQVYGLQFDLVFLLLGLFYVLPVYYYTPLIYALFKANRESAVIRVSLAAAAVNLLLNLVLIPPFGIFGALMGAAVGQWLAFLYYLIWSRAKVLRTVHTTVSST